ncbi:MAG: hypothetical protein KDJ80_13295 [Nitratireductor sp.]|nr:hypothetical protein [Nitratireductor sp.]
MRIVFAAAAMVATLIAGAASAAEIGRVEIDGRLVILNDDNRWEYASEAPAVSADCTDVASEVVPVTLCLDPEKWTFADLGGEAEIKLRLKKSELYLLVISEETEIDIPALKKAAITNAQSASGLTKVKTLSDGAASLDGHEFGKIEYATNVDGIDISYANYMSTFDGKGSVQLVFFTSNDLFDEMQSDITEVIAGVKIGG